jgi:hypothetical protein
MSFWKKQEGGNNWQVASDVTADSINSRILKQISGVGVLVNMKDKKTEPISFRIMNTVTLMFPLIF